MHPRDKHKGSDLDTNNKQLTDNDKKLYLTTDGTAYQLNIRNQTVVINNAVATVVALPSVAWAKNLTFTISVENDGNAITLTTYPNDTYDDSESWGGDYTLDAEDDSITLKSTGSAWSVVSNDIS